MPFLLLTTRGCPNLSLWIQKGQQQRFVPMIVTGPGWEQRHWGEGAGWSQVQGCQVNLGKLQLGMEYWDPGGTGARLWEPVGQNIGFRPGSWKIVMELPAAFILQICTISLTGSWYSGQVREELSGCQALDSWWEGKIGRTGGKTWMNRSEVYLVGRRIGQVIEVRDRGVRGPIPSSPSLADQMESLQPFRQWEQHLTLIVQEWNSVY